MSISKKVRWIILLCSIISYILSLFLPTLLYSRGGSDSGGLVLELGWLGILGFVFAWLANPVYFIAVIAYIIVNSSSIAKRPTVPLFLTVIALALGATSFQAKGLDLNTGPIGPRGTIMGLGYCFFLWMLSFLILLIGCFIQSMSPNTDTSVS